MNEITLEQSDRFSCSTLHLSRIKLFGLYIHSQFLLLLVLEIIISATVVYVAGSYLDIGLASFEFDSVTYFKIVSVPLVLSISMAGVGLYSSHQSRNMLAVAVRFAVAVLLSMASFGILVSLVPSMMLSIEQYILMMATSLFGLVIIRFCFYRLLNQVIFERRVLVLGAGHRAQSIVDLAKSEGQSAFDLIGFYKVANSTDQAVDPEKLLDDRGSLQETVDKYRINEIVIALDDRRQQLPSDDLLDCKMGGVSIVDVLDFLERESGKIHFDLLHPSWLIYTNGFNSYFFSSFLKRCFDVICSVFLAFLTTPVFIITALLIWLEGKGKEPIFYQQQRIGLNGSVFNVLKFRSMKTDAEIMGVPVWAEEEDPRVTAVGRVIRKYRIDELPQLLNVVFGQMSLVGPRPERPSIVRKLQELNCYYNYRHRVKPGLTGWAQLRFKYGASEANAIEKLQYDIYYLKNFSILFDFCILLQTVEVVLFRKGAR